MTIPDISPPSLDAIDNDRLKALNLEINAQLAAFDDWEGFKGAYYAFWGYPPDEYQQEWHAAAQDAWERSRKGELAGMLNEAARGLHKSTFGFTFMLQKIGLYPHLSHVIVQATDDDTVPTSKLLSSCIENNPGWKLAFPNVVKDESAGWSLNGYYVKDTSIDYGDWTRKVQHDHGRDPTLKMVSAASGSIGMHPTGIMDLDDIHNFKNTVSDVEMERTKNSIKSDVFGTMNRTGHKPMLMDNFTPKRENDMNAELKASGVFKHLFLPAFRYDPDGKDVWDGQNITRASDKVDLAALANFRKIMGSKIFRSEHLLDLSSDPEGTLLFFPYLSDSIDPKWIVHGGCDPGSTEKDSVKKMRKQSHFALAYVAEIPAGGAVVVDGVLEQCSQLEGERHILRSQSLFVNWTDTIVESVGFGKIWLFNARQRHPGLKVREGDLKGFGRSGVYGGDKGERLTREMYPWFENGTIRISTAQTPFLNALRKWFQEFKTLDEHDPAWDAADSVYHALKGMLHVLRVPETESGGLPDTHPQRRKPNPMASMLRMN